MNNSVFSEWLTRFNKIYEACDDQEVRRILSRNVTLRLPATVEDINEFFNKCFFNFQEFQSIKFASNALYAQVLKIILDIGSLSLKKRHANYINFLKLVLRMLKTNSTNSSSSNIHIIDNMTVGLMFINSICRDFTLTLKDTDDASFTSNSKLNSRFNILNIQLKLIIEILKMFQLSICVKSELIETFLALEVSSDPIISKDFKQQFKNILLNQLNLHGKFKQLFNIDLIDAHVTPFYQLCLEIADKLLEQNSLTNAFPIDDDQNFCLQLIFSVSKNPQIIDTELFDHLVEKTMQILYSRSMKPLNFQFIEKSIIRGIFSDDLWISVTCFHLMCEYLLRIKSCDAVKTYFDFFQDLSSRISSSPCESLTQFFVTNILDLIVEAHSRFLTLRDLQKYNGEKIDLQGKFEFFFDRTLVNPTAENYMTLLNHLKVMGLRGKDSLNLSEEESQKFNRLLEIVRECDWMIHSTLIENIMSVMIASSDPVQKMTFMVTINKELTFRKKKPLHLKLKLLDLIFAYIPLAAQKIGLPGILKKELTAILQDTDHTVVLEFAVKQKLDEMHSDSFVESLKKSLKNDIKSSVTLPTFLKSTKHFKKIQNSNRSKLKSINKNTEPRGVRSSLLMLLKSSEEIDSQTLNESEKQVIRKTIRNLESAIR